MKPYYLFYTGRQVKQSSISNLDYSFEPRHALIGAQMFFIAFGALVLVPILTGMSSSVAMFTAGVGTLIFQLITRGRIPIFLGSSFAFIAPIIYGVQTWGLASTLCGLAATGIVYIGLGLLVKFQGVGIIQRLLPPIVTGPVIMVIGLSLAPVAIGMATKLEGGNGVTLEMSQALFISMGALAGTIIASIFGRGVIKLIPILCGITVGYLLGLYYGIVDFSGIKNSAWLVPPTFTFMKFNIEAVFFILPVAIAPIIEHVGNIVAIGSITGRDYLKDPGLDKTLIGDGFSIMFASVVGGPPNTTYSEVSGGIALTKAYNPGVLTWAALSAICLSFVGKLSAFLSSIPPQVMGGIMVLLFGAIVVVGMNTLVKSGEDLMIPRNMAIVAVVLVFGLGGLIIETGEISLQGIGFSDVKVNISLQGIGLAGITGLLLHLILPKHKGA